MNKLFRWQIVFIIAASINFFWGFAIVKQGQEISPVAIAIAGMIATGAVAIEFAVGHAFGLISEKNVEAKTSAVAAMVALAFVTILGSANAYGGNIITIIAGVVLFIAIPGGTFAIAEKISKEVGISKKLTFRSILNEMGAIVITSSSIAMLFDLVIK